jgi:hypothetical protein
MNPNNYASLEAGQRLLDAGIVLETDAVWAWCDKNKSMKPYENPTLYLFSHIDSKVFDHWFPAPSMGEVWRELPEQYDNLDLMVYKEAGDAIVCYGSDTRERWIGTHSNTNPTDALIDLKIWLTAQKEGNNP